MTVVQHMSRHLLQHELILWRTAKNVKYFRVWVFTFQEPLSHMETTGYSSLKAGMQQALLE